MKVTTNLVLNYLKQNKHRSIITILAITIVTILVTVVLIFLSSFQEYMENLERAKKNWEAEFICVRYSDVLEIAKDDNIKEVSIYYDFLATDNRFLEDIIDSSIFRIHLRGYDKNSLKNANFTLIKRKTSRKLK